MQGYKEQLYYTKYQFKIQLLRMTYGIRDQMHMNQQTVSHHFCESISLLRLQLNVASQVTKIQLTETLVILNTVESSYISLLAIKISLQG